jgi:hypothetical protein
MVKLDYFIDGEGSALRQPFVQLSVLRQNFSGRGFELCVSSKLLFEACAEELLNRHTTLVRRGLNFRSNLVGNTNFESLHAFQSSSTSPGPSNRVFTNLPVWDPKHSSVNESGSGATREGAYESRAQAGRVNRLCHEDSALRFGCSSFLPCGGRQRVERSEGRANLIVGEFVELRKKRGIQRETGDL